MSIPTTSAKRALITGVNGFVGGYLAEHLHATGGWDVWGVGRQPALAWPALHPHVQYRVLDLAQRAEVRAAIAQIAPDVIFHLAAQSSAHRSFAAPDETLLTNMLPQLYLFQAAIELHQNPLFVIVGSSDVYGAVRPEDLPIGEDTPLRPVSPYGVSKVTQDMLAYQYHASHQLRTIRLRPFGQLGARQTEQFVAASFAAQIARIEAGQQEPLLRVGNLAAERDFTDIRDMVQAYAQAALRGTVGAVYNLGSGRLVSIRTILDTFLEMSTHEIAVEPDLARMRPADIPRVVCDARRFHAATGWEPQIALRQTLADILDGWRAAVNDLRHRGHREH